MGSTECKQIPRKVVVKLENSCNVFHDDHHGSARQGALKASSSSSSKRRDVELHPCLEHVKDTCCRQGAHERVVPVRRGPAAAWRAFDLEGDGAAAAETATAQASAEEPAASSSKLSDALGAEKPAAEAQWEPAAEAQCGPAAEAQWKPADEARWEPAAEAQWKPVAEAQWDFSLEEELADQPTLMLARFKALPAKACRREELGLAAGHGEALSGGLLAAAFLLEQQCCSVERAGRVESIQGLPACAASLATAAAELSLRLPPVHALAAGGQPRTLE